MIKPVVWFSKILAIYTILCVGCFFMLRTSIGYLVFRDDVQFLVFKKSYLDNSLWKAAFYIHVFSAFICLLAGLTQFSSFFLASYRKLHRLFGYIYVGNIFFINFPVGMVLAVYANGGFSGKAAFITLDVLWFFFTYRALRFARERNFIEHRNYMIRSYALTFSAITLRTWKLILVHSIATNPSELYFLYAWLGFLPNLLVAEWIIRAERASASGRIQS